MPWSQVSPMDQRLQLVAEYLTGLYSMTELATSYGVSRRIGYYWVGRYQRDGHLDAGSRRPHTSPTATPADVVERLRAARAAHPSWGAGKLRQWLQRRDPTTAWPCRDTIHAVLRRHGLVRQRVRRRAALPPPVHLTVPTQPNRLWTADYKVGGPPGQHRRYDQVGRPPSRSSRSTTPSGSYGSPPSPWPASMNDRGGCPPWSQLPPRPQDRFAHQGPAPTASINCYLCPPTNVLPMSPTVPGQRSTVNGGWWPLRLGHAHAEGPAPDAVVQGRFEEGHFAVERHGQVPPSG